MDVARRDDDLARALLRGYRAAGGDPGSEGLLAFMCAVRALVRAKVDFLRAAQLTARRRTTGPPARTSCSTWPSASPGAPACPG